MIDRRDFFALIGGLLFQPLRPKALSTFVRSMARSANRRILGIQVVIENQASFYGCLNGQEIRGGASHQMCLDGLYSRSC